MIEMKIIRKCTTNELFFYLSLFEKREILILKVLLKYFEKGLKYGI